MANDILAEINDFLAETGISATYFGRLAVNNSELVGRLERGVTITLVTAAKVRAFMAERRQKATAA